MAHDDLVLTRPWRIACTVLAVFPLPGLGVFLAGHRNPHTRYRAHGIAQTLLVMLGSWPLVLPGVAGWAWAAYDAVKIHRTAVPPGPRSAPTSEHLAATPTAATKGWFRSRRR